MNVAVNTFDQFPETMNPQQIRNEPSFNTKSTLPMSNILHSSKIFSTNLTTPQLQNVTNVDGI